MAADPLTPAFLAALGKKRADAESLQADVAHALAEVVARAKKKWPGLSLEPHRYVTQLGKRIAKAESVLAALTELRTSDLYVAQAAAEGDAKAVALILEKTRADVQKSLTSMRLDSVSLDEVLQKLHARVFIAEKGAPPRIATFTGTGSLAAWLSAAATRIAIDLKRANSDTAEELDDRLSAMVAEGNDAELTFLKERYRREFREAFQATFNGLTQDERHLLRMTFLDGLTIDELSPMLGVHRATVARRIAKARDDLSNGTRKKLREKFKLTGSELDSLMRLVTSAFDISLSRVLKEPGHRSRAGQKSLRGAGAKMPSRH